MECDQPEEADSMGMSILIYIMVSSGNSGDGMR